MKESKYQSLTELVKKTNMSRTGLKHRLENAAKRLQEGNHDVTADPLIQVTTRGDTRRIAYHQSVVDEARQPGKSADQTISVFRKRYKVHVAGDDAEQLSNHVSVLQSRRHAHHEYTELVKQMVESGKSLLIRCVTGTDFFNAHNPLVASFQKRVTNEGLDENAKKIKVLLLNPFGHGAAIRARSEGDTNLKESQLTSDAITSLRFISARQRQINPPFPPIEAKWCDELPGSLLIWTAEYALVELYDHGRIERDTSGCIGRQAPMLKIDDGIPYHKVLEEGFHYAFNEKNEDTKITRYNLSEMQDIVDTQMYERRKKPRDSFQAPSAQKRHAANKTSRKREKKS